jgi:hypothetical protein
MIVQIAGDCQFPAIERGVAQPVNSLVRGEFERDKISARTADYDFGIIYSHLHPLL